MIRCDKCGYMMLDDAQCCPECKTPNWVLTDFCPYCECYHRKDQKLLCAFYRALNKLVGIPHYD